MINQPFADELYNFFQRCLSFYKEFLQLETEKFNDMSENNLATLDQHVKQEEAFMLKSRGLELERTRLISRTEIPDGTFRDILPLLESPMREKMEELHQELSKVLLDLKETNTRCNFMTELRLHRVEAELKKIQERPELQKLYNAQAQKGSPAPNFISKKI